jgi:hypothetical protein
LSEAALDRLVLASGAVPRDYLTLCVAAISKAQGRAKGRLVGVQDVNQAAGDAASAKLRELEDDLAANVGSAEQTLGALMALRAFCLEETRYTYFRIDFRDKETHPNRYAVMIALSELRLSHLVDPSVSAAHAAGERFEVFMLDLSQFSGYRLKRNLTVLDLEDGRIVSKKTRTNEAPRVGGTPRALTTILRGAPEFELAIFEPFVGSSLPPAT